MEKKPAAAVDKKFQTLEDKETGMVLSFNEYTRRYDLHQNGALVISDACRPTALFSVGANGVERRELPAALCVMPPAARPAGVLHD